MRRVFVIAVLVVAVSAVIGAVWWFSFHREKATAFRTGAVTKGDISAVISATGTVEPEQVVDVGAQVTGMVRAFGRDVRDSPVDYGLVVKEGGVLAHVLVAQRSLYTAEDALAQSSRNISTDLIAFYKALGGGWETK